MVSERLQRSLGLILIAAVASWLYLPYLSNPLLFDDVNIFHTDILTTAATTPWEIGIRGLPYFTLGWVETQIGSIEAHRLVSLALHVSVAYQLFRFLESVLVLPANRPCVDSAGEQTHLRMIALLVAVAFVCHPVAVYGAGYLAQRTIVFATMFSLLSLRAFVRAIQNNEHGSTIWAAGWASLAILSKQHAVLVPIAALTLVPVLQRPWRDSLRQCAVFLGLTAPAILLAVFTNASVVGQVYESGVRDIESEIYGLPSFSTSGEKWLLSASTQAGLFLSYWRQWLMPSPAIMSADLRVDFLRPWTAFGAWLQIGSVVMLPMAMTLLFRQPHRVRLAAFAIAWTAVLFLIELSAVRFQEPFVLYRSYLWAIGYCTFVAVAASAIPRQLALGLFVLALPVLMFQAIERLDTFRSRFNLWEDAAAKLQKLEVAGSSRIVFNRGGERFKIGNVAGALEDFGLAIRLNPSNTKFRIARAVALLKVGRPVDALEDLETAKPFEPHSAHLLYILGKALRALGRLEEADAALIDAARLGSYAARYEIGRSQSGTGDVTVELNASP